MMDGAMGQPFAPTVAARGQAARDVLVLGLGNILLGDDGVGVHVVRRLAHDPSLLDGMRPLDGGTLGFRLMEAMSRSEAVLVVDASELGERAGVIRLLEHDRLDIHIRRGGRVSAHEAGLVDLLTLAKLEGCLPSRLALLAIQPLRIDWDEALSPAVACAVDAACRMAIRTVMRWRRTA